MTDLPAAPRRYSDKDVARLLRRATELQSEGRAGVGRGGLTLAELEAAAAEAGIDVSALRRAAQELDAAPRGLGPRLWGAPMSVLRERNLPFEANPDELDQLIPLIQQAAGVPGEFTRIGRTLSWRLQDPNSVRSVEVLVSVGQGRTLIRARERFGNFAAGLFGGVVGGVGGLSLGLGAALASTTGLTMLFAGLPLLGIAASYVPCRIGFRARVRRLERALDLLTEQLEDALRTQVAGTRPPS